MSSYSKRIAELSPAKREILEQRLKKMSKDVAPQKAIPRRADSGSSPVLSFAQERLWFLEQLIPGGSIYNVPYALRLTGRLDVRSLEQSLNHIVSRHEVLRTAFRKDGPEQAISPELTLNPPVINLRQAGGENLNAEVERLASEEARTPFDLSEPPLLRVKLLEIGDDDHVLILTMHHIICDGWSMGVFTREMIACYEAFSKGRPSPLGELPIQYGDFAAWQRQWLQDEVLEKQLSYWKRQLEGTAGLLELPTDRPRLPQQSYRGARKSFSLPAALSESLKELSRRENSTLFMVLLAAFKTLLYRYTRQEDILVGSPIANRNMVEIEGLIGFFVNTLVLRTDLSGEPDFLQLLARVKDTVFGANAHQDLPFEKLVETLHPERDLSHSPLFQVMFVMQNAASAAVDVAGLNISAVEIESATAKFDITLMMWESERGLNGKIEYNTDLFDAETIDRMINHFSTLLLSIVSDPSLPISRFNLLPPSERHTLLAWNDTSASFPVDSCIHDLFHLQVLRNPEAPALCFDSLTLSYEELNRRANQLAHFLKASDVGPEVMVGVCMERSLEMVVALLGVLKAGGAYVPLDPAYPKQRLEFMLDDTAASVVLTQLHLKDSLPQNISRVICVDSEWTAISQQSEQNPISELSPENLAYVIYTSGSTGLPKGAMNTHAGIRNRLLWMQDAYRLDETDRVLQKTPYSFDVSVWEFFWPLMTGACLVVAQPGGHQDSSYLADLIVKQEITTLHFVPSMLDIFLQEPDLEKCVSLRRVICSGEALTFALQQRFFARLQAELHNLYGPTEAAVDVTYWACDPQAARQIVPIGRPISNTQIHILDSQLQPVPIGVPGELYIGGVNVARGYVARPDMTAEKFIPDPFGGREGGRLYRTGDLARFLPSADIEYLGRIDHQVKIRGFRIELDEIQSLLNLHPSVRDSVVVLHQDKEQDKRLVAYIVGEAGQEVRVSEVRAYLKEKLPDYMIPSAFVMLEQMPLTVNGKLDRRALPAPEFDRSEIKAGFVAPTNTVEELLADIWQEILGIDQVGIHDNFFDLGGHSLLAARVISRLRKVFDVEVPLRKMFEQPTVEGLAEVVEVMRRAGETLRIPAIERAGRDGRPVLSFAQQRLWFIDQLEPGKPFYNIPAFVKLSGELNLTALRWSLNELVRRHESLRTSFSSADGEPFQVIAEPRPVPSPLIDLSALPESRRELESKILASARAGQQFDLSSGPLMTVSILRLSQREHIVLLVIHHIVADGWSMNLLIDELALLYEAYLNGEPSPLPELPIQYADYARWQRQWLKEEALDAELDYWKKQLAGAPPMLELPTDRPRPIVQSYRGAAEVVELDQSLLAELQRLSRSEGVTLFMLLLSAFKVILHRYSGQRDIVVGTPIAGRNRVEVERLIGFFVNTLVIRTDLDGEPGFRELLGRVREVVLEAQAHQELPFERLVEELQPARSLSYSPLFQVMFSLNNGSGAEERRQAARLDIALLETASDTAKFDLNLMLKRTGDGLVCKFEYNTDLFDAATIRRMAGHFERVLKAAVGDPDQSISLLPLMSDDELQQLIEGWNDTSADYPEHSSIAELFEQQVELAPDKIAVIFKQQRLTYGELNARSNRLARHLLRKGVRPETRVGICLDRSAEMVVSLLAIIKTGAAYVPLDPSYPEQRLVYMFNDSQIEALITEQRHLAGLPEHDAQVVCIDSESEAILRQGEANLAVQIDPDNLAYVTYTSGSTGRPKGVAIPHRGVVRLVKQANYASLNPDEVFLLLSPIAFDVSTFELWGSLLNGATLVVMPAQKPSLDEIAAVLKNFEVTTLWLTAGLFHQMVENQVESFKGLRQLIAGGDVLSVAHVRKVLETIDDIEMINGYGPTENTTFTSCYSMKDVADLGASVYIGRPISNSRVYILDEKLQPVPVGVTGEMYAGGAGVARGYLNRPDLTAERFVPDPFGREPNSRLYRTGDMVRYLADGRIEFLGRRDNQVKLRGFRIELGEIESVLGEMEKVRDSVVVVREDEGGDKRLIAYVVAEAGGELTPGELKKYAKSKLPDYLVPSAFVLMDELPLNNNGKVDRKALPALPSEQFEGDAESVAPRTPTEEVLASIWSQVLRLKQVSVHSNFFDIGGHSLLATQIISRLREVFDVELPLRYLFESPTIAGLAERVEAANTGGLTVPPIEPVSRATPSPLSFAQQRLWFLDQMEPGSSLYNIALAVELNGALDIDALRRSVNEVVRRHEALRTRFEARNGQATQVIEPEQAIEIELLELEGQTARDHRAEIRQIAREKMRRGFDLAREQLLRVSLLKKSPREHALIIVVHHIISDGWSMGVLIHELAALYEAYATGEQSSLEELRVQYADYAAWQRDWLKGEILEEQLSYWKQQLRGSLPVLELPTYRPRPSVQTSRGERLAVSLDGELSKRLKALSQQEGATLFMTLLAGFNTLLNRYSGQSDIIVGTSIAGRRRTETEGLIGFFVNALALRTDLSGNPTVRQLLKRVRETALGAYAHQDLPFEKLIEELNPPRDLSRSPVFQVLFELQNAPMPELEIKGLSLKPLEVENDTAKFDLTVTLWETKEAITGTIEYNTDLFDTGTVRRMAAHLEKVLEAMASDAERRISDIDFLTEQEKAQVLVDWNETAVDYPVDECFPRLFERQAKQTPDRVAVAHRGERLTYAQLNRRANRLARSLVERGVGPDILVALLGERNPNLLVAILAVFKAGGAYVPLDPRYPAARLGQIVSQSKASLILTADEFMPLLSDVETTLGERSLPQILLVEDLIRTSRSDENLPVRCTPTNLAYVIYTSGSTGAPKGAMVEHAGMLNHLRVKVSDLQLSATDVVAQTASQCFDISVWQFLSPLMVGGRAHIFGDEITHDAARLVKEVDERAISIFETVPSQLSAIMKQPEAGLNRRYELKALRWLIVTGEALPPDLCREWLGAYPGIPALNAYGPTECSDDVAHYKIYSPLPENAVRVPIGYPVGNMQLYILDEGFKPVPAGVGGELYVGGIGVGRGYLGDVERTARAFVPNPFGNAPGSRLYKTGDVARYLPDGAIEFLGRIDHQVKIRGFRIEMGEIELALREHPGVHKAVAVAREDSPGEKRIVAYVVSNQAGMPAVSELRRAIQERLPEYMVPSAFVELSELPLTANGKVDRSALPAPDASRSEQGESFAEPRTATEEALAEIWSDALKLERVGIDSNFFDLGGHSLIATQVVSRVRERFGINLTLADFFTSGTIREAAERIESALLAQSDPTRIDEMLALLQGMDEGEAASLLALDDALDKG